MFFRSRFSIAVFNYFMDPYEYFGPPVVQGLNDKKLPGPTQERFDRAIKIMRKKPQAVMSGSSRVREAFPSPITAS